MLRFLFALSAAILCYLLLYGYINKKIVPKLRFEQRLRSMRMTDAVHSMRNARAEARNREARKATPAERFVKPFQKWLMGMIERHAPSAFTDTIQQKLVLAGKQYEWGFSQFVTAWGIIFFGLTFCALYFAVGHGYPFRKIILVTLLGGGIGLFYPWLILKSAIDKRQKAISKQLPEVLDLLCVSVQAGLSFDAALRKIVQRMHGPLIIEFERMLDDVRVGMVRRQALKELAKRCGLQEVNLFVSSIIQAERLGTSMSRTLENQAKTIRERRRQYVMAQAQKAPIKLLFPILLFIFPSIFVVALMPGILSMMKTLPKIMGH